MRKIICFLIILVLFSSLSSFAAADSLLKFDPKDSIEFYTIGPSENTFSGIYNRMHIYLDLNKFPVPEPDTITSYNYVGGNHEEVKVLVDDDASYEYIGYVCTPEGARVYIIWSWAGYHEDGSLIGVDSFYALNGVYLGNIQRDFTTGAALSSRNSPYFFNTGSLYGRK